MSLNRLLKKIDNFISLAEEIGEQPSINEQYQQQREMLADFHEQFTRSLRAIISELGGDFIVLKEREFDPKMLKMLAKVHKDLVEIATSISPYKPYEAATKLAHYVLNRPNGPIIDNLDFLAKHHLKMTNVDFEATEHLMHPEMRSLDRLKALSLQARRFMDEHPLLTPLVPTEIPVDKPTEVAPRPSKPEQELGTRPGSPEARKRQE